MDAFEAVSIPESSSVTAKKYFSVAEANRALTLVQRIVADIVRDYRHMRELHDTCRALDAKGKTSEAETAREKYASLTDHLSELKEELEKVGCELKDYHVGLVDFPGKLDGREICLCWKLGELKLEYWHELDSGFAGRQLLTETNIN
jgi:hypothetical protein